MINPFGFAFEDCGAIVEYRTDDNGHAVDATGRVMLDGQSHVFDGGVELSHLLAGSNEAHRCYVAHWVQYALSRDVDDEGDANLIERLTAAGRITNSSIRDMLLELATSPALLSRR